MTVKLELTLPAACLRLLRTASLPAVLLCAACGGDGAGTASEPSRFRVVLGTGEDRFEPLAEDQRVPLIRGIQGGYHIWSSFIAYGFETDVLRMELTTSIDDNPASMLQMPGNVRVRPVVDPEGEPGWASVGWPAFIDNPTCAHERRLRFDLTVRDEAGNSASDSVYCVVFVAEPYRSSDCGS